MSDDPSIEAYDAFIACLASAFSVLRRTEFGDEYSPKAGFYDSLSVSVDHRLGYSLGHALHIEDKAGLRHLLKTFQERQLV